MGIVITLLLLFLCLYGLYNSFTTYSDIHQTKKKATIKSTFGYILGIVLLSTYLFDEITKPKDKWIYPDGYKQAEAPKTPKEKAESAFSAWDGSHYKLVAYVKERLNDPNSFEHAKTWYNTYDNDYIVWMEYRAKNGYGALMLYYIKAKCSYDTGEILEVIETR